MKNLYFNILITCYVLIVISLFFFSFTQVDLGLTLTKWSVWLEFQKFFQTIGYFNRPFATAWYILTLFLLWIFYLLFLFLVAKKQISTKQCLHLVFAASIILLFSYNAFSYDLFNYIFDVKIVTFYHENPYTHRALDYAGNPMLGFMHWTQRTYPYGPFWLFVTVPLGLLDGFRLLLPTIMLFKSVAFGSYLVSVYGIKKILDKISPQNALFGVTLFSFNPLVLIESLVSAHNDIFMMAISIWAIYYFLDKKYFRSILLLVLSIGVKFATAFLIPAFFWITLLYIQRKKIDWDKISFSIIFCMLIPVVIASMRTNFQPWYLLYVLPFAALHGKKYVVLIPTVIVSFFALFEYIPFFYTGNWDAPIPTILLAIRVVGIVFSAFLILFWFLRKRLVR